LSLLSLIFLQLKLQCKFYFTFSGWIPRIEVLYIHVGLLTN